MRLTRALLVEEPEGVDATIVACPSCFAWVGWACGESHCEGYHRKRIVLAKAQTK